MTIARACRPPTQENAGGWQAAGGLLSTLLVSRVGSSSQKSGLHLHPTEPRERENHRKVPLSLGSHPRRHLRGSRTRPSIPCAGRFRTV